MKELDVAIEGLCPQCYDTPCCCRAIHPILGPFDRISADLRDLRERAAEEDDPVKRAQIQRNVEAHEEHLAFMRPLVEGVEKES